MAALFRVLEYFLKRFQNLGRRAALVDVVDHVLHHRLVPRLHLANDLLHREAATIRGARMCEFAQV